MARICAIGAVYVGLVAAECLADRGNLVVNLDVDSGKLMRLRSGIVPTDEPGLQGLVGLRGSSERQVRGATASLCGCRT